MYHKVCLTLCVLLQAAAAAYAADRAALEQQLAKLASEARKQEKAAAAKLAAAQRDREKEKEGHAVELEQLVAEKEVNTMRKRFLQWRITQWRLKQWRLTRIWRSGHPVFRQHLDYRKLQTECDMAGFDMHSDLK